MYIYIYIYHDYENLIYSINMSCIHMFHVPPSFPKRPHPEAAAVLSRQTPSSHGGSTASEAPRGSRPAAGRWRPGPLAEAAY